MRSKHVFDPLWSNVAASAWVPCDLSCHMKPSLNHHHRTTLPRMHRDQRNTTFHIDNNKRRLPLRFRTQHREESHMDHRPSRVRATSVTVRSSRTAFPSMHLSCLVGTGHAPLFIHRQMNGEMFTAKINVYKREKTWGENCTVKKYMLTIQICCRLICQHCCLLIYSLHLCGEKRCVFHDL